MKRSPSWQKNPGAARERTELGPPVRVHPYRAHLVIDEIEAGDVFVLRVRHGHEDWQTSPVAS